MIAATRPTVRYKPGFGPNGARVAKVRAAPPEPKPVKPARRRNGDTPFIAAIKRHSRQFQPRVVAPCPPIDPPDFRKTALLNYWNDEPLEVVYRETPMERWAVRDLLGIPHPTLSFTIDPADYGTTADNQMYLIRELDRLKMFDKAGFHDGDNSINRTINEDGTVTFSQRQDEA